MLLLAGLPLAPPFWETRPPSQWTDAELKQLLTDSPWAQQALAAEPDGVPVYLASARPMREAEREFQRRGANPNPAEDPAAGEYRDFLRENQGRYIVLAVALPKPDVLDDPAERRHMEEECVLEVGRKKFKMTGHFPPSLSDPYLRLVFPRAATAADKSFRFNLYLPSMRSSYRAVEFRVKELYYRGALEM